MQILKILILIIGVLISVYHLYSCFKRIQIDVVRFNLKEILGRKSISNSSSGNLVLDGLLALFFVVVLYILWF